MSNYNIKPLQIKKAEKLGLTIKPSTNKKKKVEGENSEEIEEDLFSYKKREKEKSAEKKKINDDLIIIFEI